MKSDRQVLEEAAELITGEGHWCQNKFWDGGDRYCVEGALRKSIGVLGIPICAIRKDRDVQQLIRITNLLSGQAGVPMPRQINDMPSTTQEDMILLLKRTAEVAQE
jgi:hypothetical protein